MRLVLVYLGDSIPDYVWGNIKHLLSIQGKHDIDFIVSKENLDKKVVDPRIKYFRYQPTSEIDELLETCEIDRDFRSGFWRYSLERLIALAMHHERFSNESMLHIESDVLLLPNFPFSQFQILEKISWTRVDSTRDVATLIYIPSSSDSSQFKYEILKEIGLLKSPDDMTVLRLIAEGNPSSYGILPTISNPNSNLLNQSLAISDEARDSMSNGFRIFDGIFDAAGIGIWLTGTDPRNYFGVTKRYFRKLDNSGSDYIKPDLADFEFDESGVLSVTDHRGIVPIFNLHIHSKNSEYFAQNYISQLGKDVERSKHGNTVNIFSLKIFLQLVLQNARKGTLVRYLAWLPFVQRVKKWLVTVRAKD